MWSWIGKGRPWTFQKTFTYPRFDQEQQLHQQIEKAPFPVSFSWQSCASLCKSPVQLFVFSPLSVAELLPLCEWEGNSACMCYFFFLFFFPIRQWEKFGVDWVKSVMFEGNTGLRGRDP